MLTEWEVGWVPESEQRILITLSEIEPRLVDSPAHIAVTMPAMLSWLIAT